MQATRTVICTQNTCAQIYCCLAQFCLQWIVHSQSRERMRNKYGLEATPCSDCCVTFWCARLARVAPKRCANCCRFTQPLLNGVQRAPA